MMFDIETTKFDIEMKKINNDFLTEYAMMEFDVFESEGKSESSNFLDSLKNTIDKIIKAIVNFFAGIKSKISELFSKKDKEAIKNAVENINELENPNEKVKVFDSEKAKAVLDDYLQKMLKLERELLNLDADYNSPTSLTKTGKYIHEYEKIEKEIDKLNSEFDEKFFADNAFIIEMAKKDAIRFSDKQLNNIGVDYDAIEKGSKKILAQFKTDANGCREKKKTLLIQKMCQCIGTTTRRSASFLTKRIKVSITQMAALSIVAFKLKPVVKKLAPVAKDYADKISKKEMTKKGAVKDIAGKVKNTVTSKIQDFKDKYVIDDDNDSNTKKK